VRDPPAPTATAISFIDRINRSDLDGLDRLTADHTLQVFDEDPVADFEHEQDVEPPQCHRAVVGKTLNEGLWIKRCFRPDTPG
jgi:hypothetical protein